MTSRFERRYERVTASHGSALVAEVAAWVAWLERTHPSVVSGLDAELTSQQATLEALTREALTALKPLRAELTERLPDAADQHVFGAFDDALSTLAQGGPTLPRDWARDEAPWQPLATTLRSQFNDAIQLVKHGEGPKTPRPDIEREVLRQGHSDFERTLFTTLDAYERAYRRFALTLGASASTSFSSLKTALEAATAQLFARDFDERQTLLREHANRCFLHLRDALEAEPNEARVAASAAKPKKKRPR